MEMSRHFEKKTYTQSLVYMSIYPIYQLAQPAKCSNMIQHKNNFFTNFIEIMMYEYDMIRTNTIREEKLGY